MKKSAIVSLYNEMHKVSDINNVFVYRVHFMTTIMYQ